MKAECCSSIVCPLSYQVPVLASENRQSLRYLCVSCEHPLWYIASVPTLHITVERCLVGEDCLPKFWILEENVRYRLWYIVGILTLLSTQIPFLLVHLSLHRVSAATPAQQSRTSTT